MKTSVYGAGVTLLRRVRIVAAAIVLSAGVAGCAESGTGSTGPTESATGSTGPRASGSETDAAAPAALQFAAPLVGGGKFDGADVAGSPVVLWFWAPT